MCVSTVLGPASLFFGSTEVWTQGPVHARQDSTSEGPDFTLAVRGSSLLSTALLQVLHIVYCSCVQNVSISVFFLLKYICCHTVCVWCVCACACMCECVRVHVCAVRVCVLRVYGTHPMEVRRQLRLLSQFSPFTPMRVSGIDHGWKGRGNNPFI